MRAEELLMARKTRDVIDKPIYKMALGAIGRYFDQQTNRGIFLAETADGYVGKAYSGAAYEAEMHAEGFSFPHEDIRALIASPIMHAPPPTSTPPNCVYGYGLFMQAVGDMCDRSQASYVSILEVTQGFIVSYTLQPDTKRAPERISMVLDRTGIDDIMNQSELHA